MADRNDRTTADRWQEWESKYHETGNVEYAVLALGKWGRTAPDWAFLACSKYLQSEERRAHGNYLEDGHLLDKMAPLIGSGMTVHGAAQALTQEGYNGPNTHRLMRKWRDELKRTTIFDPITDAPIHPRMERVAVWQAKRRGSFFGPHNPYNVPPVEPEGD